MACSNSSPEPSLRDLLFDAFVASTDPNVDALTAYGRYREAFVACMTAGDDPAVYKVAYKILTDAADSEADQLADGLGDAVHLRGLIKTSFELLP